MIKSELLETLRWCYSGDMRERIDRLIAYQRSVRSPQCTVSSMIFTHPEIDIQATMGKSEQITLGEIKLMARKLRKIDGTTYPISVKAKETWENLEDEKCQRAWLCFSLYYPRQKQWIGHTIGMVRDSGRFVIWDTADFFSTLSTLPLARIRQRLLNYYDSNRVSYFSFS